MTRKRYLYLVGRSLQAIAALSLGLWGAEISGLWHITDHRLFLFAFLLLGSWAVVFRVHWLEED